MCSYINFITGTKNREGNGENKHEYCAWNKEEGPATIQFTSGEWSCAWSNSRDQFQEEKRTCWISQSLSVNIKDQLKFTKRLKTNSLSVFCVFTFTVSRSYSGEFQNRAASALKIHTWTPSIIKYMLVTCNMLSNMLHKIKSAKMIMMFCQETECLFSVFSQVGK